MAIITALAIAVALVFPSAVVEGIGAAVRRHRERKAVKAYFARLTRGDDNPPKRDKKGVAGNHDGERENRNPA